MSVFIASRRTGRSRPVATRRYTTKGAGPAWMPGPADSALPDPPSLYRHPRCPGPGDGLARSWLNRHVFGDGIYGAFQQIKAAFDPLCLLNCDKVVRVQKPKRGEVAEW